jgi:hypothetical protein
MAAIKAINRAVKPQSSDAAESPYEICMERVKHEIDHAPNLFGGPLDGVALAAWYHRVVIALRMGASAYDYLDTQRHNVATTLRPQNAEYQNLRIKEDPTLDEINRVEQIKASISQTVEEYYREIPRSLRAIEGDQGRRGNVVIECINPLNAAIIAFYAKTNPRIINPDICRELGTMFGAALESLVWLGRVHRERTRTLTPEIAYALLATVNGEKMDADTRKIIDECMEVGYSFLDIENRAALIEAAWAAAATGKSRTVLFGLRSAQKRVDGAVDTDVPLAPNMPNTHPELVNDLAAGQQLYALDTDTGRYAGAFPALRLSGTFLSLPPFYNRDWARRWRIVKDQDNVFERFTEVVSTMSSANCMKR